MNALKPTLLRTTLLSTIRKASTQPSFVPKQYHSSFKKEWLSDPSTYPIIVIMGCAVTFVVGMSVNALTTYKDVRIDPKKRSTLMRDWGEEEYNPLLKKVIYWNSWQKHSPEGLGTDHDEWVAFKKEYNKDVPK